jgi:hypothetical protein
MTDYVVKVGFWLRAYDSVTVEADGDVEAIEKAKVAAATAMISTAHPEHVAFDERREGVIAFIDRVSPDGRHSVVEDVAFDGGRSHPTAEEARPRRVVFAYQVPVHVEVEDGLVSRVTVIDETPVADPTVVDGDASYLAEAVAAADDGQAWPLWQFGY